MNIEKRILNSIKVFFASPNNRPDSNPTRPELPDQSLQVGKCRSSIKTKWERHLRKDMVYHGPLETNSESRLVANSCMKVNKSHDVLVYVSEREREHYYFTQSYCHSRILKKIEIFCFAKIYDGFRVSGFWGADLFNAINKCGENIDKHPLLKHIALFSHSVVLCGVAVLYVFTFG